MQKTPSPSEARLEKEILDLAIDKRMTHLETKISLLESNVTTMSANISTTSVQLGSVERKLDRLQSTTDKVNTKLYGNSDAKIDGFLEQLERMLATFVTKKDFEEHLEDSEKIVKDATPVINWGKERMVIEKWMIALVSLIGLSSVVNIAIVVIDYIKNR